MATERKAPDAILALTALTGVVTVIQDDPDSADALWLLYDGLTNGNTACRVSFGTPSGNLNTGAGLQEFRLWLRKNASGGNSCTVNIDLYENGSFVATLASGVSVTSTTGEIVAATWDASLLSGIDGANVEVLMQQASGGSTGGGSNRRRIEVGAIEWNANYSNEVTGSGAAAAGPATVAGSGVSSSLGTGTAAAQDADAAGAGLSESLGTGDAAAQAAAVSGVGEVGEPSVTGTGAAVAQDANVDGLGLVIALALGDVLAPASAVDGAGVAEWVGIGAAVAQASTAAGEGTVSGEAGEPAQAPVAVNVPGMLGRRRIRGRLRLEHAGCTGGLSFGGMAVVKVHLEPAPVEEEPQAPPEPPLPPLVMAEPDLAAAERTLARLERRRLQVRRTDAALLGL